MRKISPSVVLAGSALLTIAALAPAQNRPGQRQPPLISPQVSTEKKITFRVRAPKAEAVRLVGSDIPGTGRGVAMKKGAGDVWEASVGPVPPGAYRYHFNIDGVAVIDPCNPSTSESNNNTWSLVYVPGSEISDIKNVPHGAVAAVHYYSKSLKRFRRMHVYTPPGYERSDNKYPVFYLLHGASDSDASWSTVGRAGFILDNLIAEGKAKPMIVVMPAGHTGPFRFGGAPGTARRRDEFAEDFVNNLKPYVEKHYRTRADRAHRAIAGLSMGGMQTLNIAFDHLDEYGYIGVFSSGIFGIAGGRNSQPNRQWEEQHKSILDNPELKKDLKLLWIGCGKEDFLVQTSNATVEMLKRHHFDVVSRESAGGHTWINWRNYLHEFAPLLFVNAPAARRPGRGPRRAIVLNPDDVPAFPDPPAGFDKERKDVPHGKLEMISYQSKSVGTTRKMQVYTPPGYSKKKKYPVLYLLHGIGGDETEWQRLCKPNIVLENLLADGKVTPMIVVMPNGRAQKNDRAEGNVFRSAPAFAAFEQDLLKDVIPAIEARYSVQADREHRALAGLSMGGGQSLNFGLAHLDTFAWVGAFSAAPNTKRPAQLVPDPAVAKKKLKLLWLGCGKRDGLIRISQGVHAYLKEKDVPHVWHVDGNAHDPTEWKNNLYLFAQRLFR